MSYNPSQARAPSGGITIGGIHFKGGEWITKEAMANASPQEKASLAQMKGITQGTGEQKPMGGEGSIGHANSLAGMGKHPAQAGGEGDAMAPKPPSSPEEAVHMAKRQLVRGALQQWQQAKSSLVGDALEEARTEIAGMVHAAHGPKEEKKTEKGKKTGSLSQYEKALKELPDGVEHDPVDMKTIKDLVWSAKLQLDLIESGEDGTEDMDKKAIIRWLKKYDKPDTPADIVNRKKSKAPAKKKGPPAPKEMSAEEVRAENQREFGEIEKARLTSIAEHDRRHDAMGSRIKGGPAHANEAAIAGDVMKYIESNPSAWTRRNLKDAYQEIGQKHGLSVRQFQGILMRMQDQKKIRMGPYTQPIGTHEAPEHLIPMDREYKYYMEKP